MYCTEYMDRDTVHQHIERAQCIIHKIVCRTTICRHQPVHSQYPWQFHSYSVFIAPAKPSTKRMCQSVVHRLQCIVSLRPTAHDVPPRADNIECFHRSVKRVEAKVAADVVADRFDFEPLQRGHHPQSALIRSLSVYRHATNMVVVVAAMMGCRWNLEREMILFGL